MPEPPSRTRAAVGLLWASLTISTAASLIEIWVSAENEPTRLVDTAWLLGFSLLFTVPIYFIGQRANWARVVVLALVCLGAIAFPIVWLYGGASVVNVILVFTGAMDVTAVVLLFTRGSSEWFRHRREEAF